VDCNVEEQPDEYTEDSPGCCPVTNHVAHDIEGGRPRKKDQSGKGEYPPTVEGAIDPIGEKPDPDHTETGADAHEDEE
jgi:hypothetical protein